MKRLNEKTMCSKEKRIPQLAEHAVKQARTKTLASGRSVVEAVNGKLIEFHPDGTYKELKSLPARTCVIAGQRKIRKIK